MEWKDKGIDVLDVYVWLHWKWSEMTNLQFLVMPHLPLLEIASLLLTDLASLQFPGNGQFTIH